MKFAARKHAGGLMPRLAACVLSVCWSMSAWSGTPGEDGTVTISSAGNVINGYTLLNGNVAVGATSFSVISTTALALPAGSGVAVAGRPLAIGDLLMIYQVNGATIDTTDTANYGAINNYGNAGKYEFVTVKQISGNTITIATGPQSVGGRPCTGMLNAYSDGAMVIRVPQYAALTIDSTASAVAQDFDGSLGGVVVMDVQNTLTLRGTVSANAAGFRGGAYHDNANDSGTATTLYRSANGDDGGEKGEGIAGPAVVLANGAYGRGAPANGGGGGNGHNASGGGGANGGTGTWNGTGSKDRGASNAYDAAWNLEAAGFATSVSPGGGRGGYSFSLNDQNALTLPTGDANWGGNSRRNVGGFGGRPLSRTGERLFFGGGGGAGDGNNFAGDNTDGNNTTGNGGDGGGLVFIVAGAVSTTGGAGAPRLVSANGAAGGSSSAGPAGNGGRDGSGGGGAGGTVVMVVDGALSSNVTINAQGGVGGTQTIVGFGTEAEGPGGGGGGGVIAVTSGSGTPTRSVTAGNNGTTTSGGLTEFPPNGATRGTAGESGTGPTRTSGPLACALPVSLAYVYSWPTASGVEVRFSTATETDNVGFRVGHATLTGKRASALVGSAVVNSLTPADYALTLPAGTTEFTITDVATDGSEREHGPFAVGARYGGKPEVERIDWNSIAAEAARPSGRTAKASAREAVLTVARDGIYRVTHADLLAAGVDLSGAKSADVALVRLGEAVPRRVLGGETWNTASAVEFLGRAGKTLYGQRANYRLAIDAEYARAVSETLLAPRRVVPALYTGVSEYAPKNQYSFASPSGDPWFADALLATRGGISGKEILLRGAAAAGVDGEARLELSLWGVTDFEGEAPDHHFTVQFNDQLLAAEVSDGLRAIDLEQRLPLSAVREGERNRLRIEVQASAGYDFDLINVTSARLSYPARPYGNYGLWQGREVRAQDAAPADAGFSVPGFDNDSIVAYRANGDRVEALARPNMDRSQSCCAPILPFGAADDEYFVAQTSELGRPTIRALGARAALSEGPADYLVISHASFIDGLAPLVALHQAQGLRVKVVDVAEVYRQFADGEATPDAIADYIAFAYESLGTRFVLLVGGDTYDYDDNLRLGSVSFLPTYYRRTGGLVRYAPSDAPYADVDGDARPDVALGRWPVRNRAELDAVVNKTIAFAARADKKRALFVAAKAETDLDFAGMSDDFAASLAPAGIDSSKAYVDRLGVAATRAQLLSEFNAGRPLIGFVGHSGADRWSFDPLFTLADARVLGNGGAPSAVVQFGCYNAYFVNPQANTLAHGLLFNANGGAALVIGASTLTDVEAHRALGALLYPRLVAGDTFGEALTAAKRALYDDSAFGPEVGLGVTLLGDPALSLR